MPFVPRRAMHRGFYLGIRSTWIHQNVILCLRRWRLFPELLQKVTEDHSRFEFLNLNRQLGVFWLSLVFVSSEFDLLGTILIKLNSSKLYVQLVQCDVIARLRPSWITLIGWAEQKHVFKRSIFSRYPIGLIYSHCVEIQSDVIHQHSPHIIVTKRSHGHLLEGASLILMFMVMNSPVVRLSKKL